MRTWRVGVFAQEKVFLFSQRSEELIQCADIDTGRTVNKHIRGFRFTDRTKLKGRSEKHTNTTQTPNKQQSLRIFLSSSDIFLLLSLKPITGSFTQQRLSSGGLPRRWRQEEEGEHGDVFSTSSTSSSHGLQAEMLTSDVAGSTPSCALCHASPHICLPAGLPVDSPHYVEMPWR